MAAQFRVALIGGTSHVGKSTTAAALAARLEWPWVSTDAMLGRHPGRPWSTPTFTLPDHVIEHYQTQTAEEVTRAQLAHYQSKWPIVAARIASHVGEAADPLVIEGSGVLPDRFSALAEPGARAVWLTAAPDLIAERIRLGSGYRAATAEARSLVDKFTRRSQLYDAEVIAEARRLGLPVVEVREADRADTVVAACLERLRG